MKKQLIVAALAAATAVTGCKNISVERNGQALATVENADGSVEVVKDASGNPVILDRGWEASYFQHWNWQKFDSMEVNAGDKVSLKIGNYEGGADATNLTGIVSASFSGGAQLAVAIGDAYVKIAGGGAQAATVTDVAGKVYSFFTSSGGDASKATVMTDSSTGTLKVTDGTTCVQCDASGNCTACTD